jgi:hypothetical protein
MTDDLFLIKRTIADIVEVALSRHQGNENPASDDLTQRQAYEMFGEAWVKKCVKLGLADKKRRGIAENSPIYYSKTELMSIRAAERANKSNVFAGTLNPVIKQQNNNLK